MLKVGRIHNADHQPPLHLDVGGKKGGRKSPDLTPAAAPGSQWDLSLQTGGGWIPYPFLTLNILLVTYLFLQL